MKTKKMVILLATLGSLTVSSAASGIIHSSAKDDFIPSSDATIIKTSTIRSMMNDKAGNFWIGNDSSRLYEKISGQTSFTEITIEGMKPGNDQTINKILQDKDGNIWLATQDGIFIQKASAKDNNFAKYTLGLDGLESADFFDIAQDNSGNIWIVSPNHDNFILELKTITDGFKKIATPTTGINSIAVDKSGNIWFIVNNDGSLWTTDPTNPTNFIKFDNKDKTLGDGFEIFIDSKNNIWLRSSLGIFEKKDLGTYFDSKNFPTQAVPHINFNSTFYEDKNQNLWIGSNSDGVFKQTSDNNYKKYQSGLPNNQITCVASDNDGHLWLAVEGNGVYTSSFKTSSNSSSTLSTGAIIGIIIGSIAGVALIAGGAYFYMNKSKTSKFEGSKK